MIIMTQLEFNKLQIFLWITKVQWEFHIHFIVDKYNPEQFEILGMTFSRIVKRL